MELSGHPITLLVLSQIELVPREIDSSSDLTNPILVTLLVVIGGTMLAGFLMPPILSLADVREPDDDDSAASSPYVGAIIGRCENIIAILMVMLGEYTGLGLIIAAKSILRFESRANASYYLLGTLVNLVISLTFGLIGQVLLLHT